ncbi:hypothetical protein ABEB36_012720 [Hypothenemus hampei]|uniref:RING-type E3 ubiquitin transferase n=1 Tax=Hypothenemus hampei TaxID=57062 RepID=A0ABD1ECB5_HYPHA
MSFTPADVTDILRCNQRDQAFVSDLEGQLHSFFKHLNTRTYLKIQKSIPFVANAWYYYMTSLKNLQTLGEEYTGTIRLINGKTTPSNQQQLIWLLLYIGGEPLVDRLISYVELQVSRSSAFTQQAKDVLLKCVRTFRDQKFLLKKIHHFLFYINGQYYNISNRSSGIKYVVLRDWMRNDTFSGSFSLLGKLSLFYILYNMVQTVLYQEKSNDNRRISLKTAKVSSKFCILCVDNIKNATTTPCGHIFCWDCLYDSLKYQKICPVCRVEVSTNRIIYLQNYS